MRAAAFALGISLMSTAALSTPARHRAPVADGGADWKISFDAMKHDFDLFSAEVGALQREYAVDMKIACTDARRDAGRCNRDAGVN
jgi:hypothetical protein